MNTPEAPSGPAPLEALYRFCDVLLSLRAAREGVIPDFDRLYAAFRVRQRSADAHVTCLIDTDDSGRGHVEVGGTRRDVPMPDPASAYASWIVWEAVAAASRTHFFLHAAAVYLDDHAVLIAGPTGSGKSTLADAMADAGADRLNDDITSVERSSGIAEHFPKGEPDIWIDPRRRRRVSAVAFLGRVEAERALHLAVDRFPDEWHCSPPWELAQGVVVRKHPDHWQIQARSATPGAVERLREACRAGGVTILRDLGAGAPLFASAPQLEPISAALAMPLLAANLFGRGEAPATELAWELAATFRRVTFWQLVPGPPRATAEALVTALHPRV